VSRRTYISRSPAETRRLAARLLGELPGRAVIALHGELGSGKTCFVQGLAAALGVGQPVTSPTFTMISEYRGRRPLYHIDLYRLSRPEDILALGIEEYFEAEGIKAIEWAERAADLLPADAVHVVLTALKSFHRRRIAVEGPGARAPRRAARRRKRRPA
jgi:tRNA threonylcarbamoyladenosine biosynthesis protein TsaE